MERYIFRRLATTIGVMFGLTTFIFLLLRLAPGSPVYLLIGEYPSPDKISELNRQFGFDRPLYIQYARFLGDIAHGNLGTSIVFQTPSARLVLQRFPATLELSACSILLTIIVAIPLGLAMGVMRRSWVDHAGTIVTMSGVSAPSFWMGVMLILIFAVKLGWFATSGRGLPLQNALYFAALGDVRPLGETLRHLVLPTVTLAAFEVSFISRIVRGSILEELGQYYIRAAHARGLPPVLVIGKHALRNALLPLVTVLGLEIGGLVGGTVITEAVFAWPGVGQLIFQAVSGRDYPLAQAGILLTGGFVVLLNFLVDLSYVLIDPRIKYEVRGRL